MIMKESDSILLKIDAAIITKIKSLFANIGQLNVREQNFDEVKLPDKVNMSPAFKQKRGTAKIESKFNNKRRIEIDINRINVSSPKNKNNAVILFIIIDKECRT